MINKPFKGKISPTGDKIVDIIEKEGVKNGYHLGEKQKEFIKKAVELIAKNDKSDNEDKINAISAPCGFGKSSLLKGLITWYAQNDESAVFITDSIERLNDAYDVDDFTKNNIFKFEGEMSFMAVKDEMMDKTIVFISTQKYFNLSKEFREILFKYRYRKEIKQRRRVFFDEKPYFYKVSNFGIKELNDIDSLLRSELDETITEKNRIIELFTDCKEKLIQFMESSEKENYTDKLCFVNPKELDNYGVKYDEELFKLLKKYYPILSENNIEAYKLFENFRTLCEEGGFFTSTKKTNGYMYSKQFFIYKDYYEFFTSDSSQTKFYIFDATAYIDPMYNQECITKHKFTEFYQKQPLKIKIVNISTGKTAFTNERIEETIRYIKATKSVDEPLIMTYTKVEKDFSKIFKNVIHFGNIKGFNKYSDISECFHVGINRFADTEYYFMTCAIKPEYYTDILKMSKKDTTSFFDIVFKRDISFGNSRTEIKDYKKEINENIDADRAEQLIIDMERNFVDSIIADFEQNIFRMSIRKYNNSEQNTAYLLLNTNVYLNKLVIDRIEEIYRGRYDVEILDEPPMIGIANIEKRKSKRGKTHAQQILGYLKKLSIGDTFRIKDLLNGTGLTIAQFNKVKENNPAIKAIFKDLRIKGYTYCIKEDVVEKYKIKIKKKDTEDK